jgi:hypothetical protein
VVGMMRYKKEQHSRHTIDVTKMITNDRFLMTTAADIALLQRASQAKWG